MCQISPWLQFYDIDPKRFRELVFALVDHYKYKDTQHLQKCLEDQEFVIAPARLRDFYKTYILNISNNLWVCLGSGIMFFYIVQNRLGESNPCSKYICKFVKAFRHKIDISLA